MSEPAIPKVAVCGNLVKQSAASADHSKCARKRDGVPSRGRLPETFIPMPPAKQPKCCGHPAATEYADTTFIDIFAKRKVSLLKNEKISPERSI
jgi:hypothetical protein